MPISKITRVLLLLLFGLTACTTSVSEPDGIGLADRLFNLTSTPFFPLFRGEEETIATPEAEPTEAATEAPQSEEVCKEPAAGFPRYARLMHDPQWMPWVSRIANPDWPRGFSLDWYPETVPLWVNPKSGDGSVIYTIEWLEYLRDLQPNDDAAEWIARIAAGLFNKGNPEIPILDLDKLDELPRAEGISSGGNVVNVLETRSGSARVEMIYINNSVPDPDELNYFNYPWLVTKFTSVSATGESGNAGGIDVYFPNLAKDECGYWVELERVELFPKVPFDAVAQEDLAIYNEADTSSGRVGSLGAGGSLTVVEYLPQASDVWGRTERGWVLLEYQVNGIPVYTTSWSMETSPPILIP